jgi:hypothetical protein
MPASQAGRCGFDSHRPLQVLKINDLDSPAQNFFPQKRKNAQNVPTAKLATVALYAGGETGGKQPTEKLNPIAAENL